MSKKNTIFIVLVVIVVGFAGFYLGSQIGKKLCLPCLGCPEITVTEEGGFMFIGEPDIYNDSDNPHQSPPVEDITEMAKEFGVKPDEIIKIGIKDYGFQPAKFEVKAGEKVVLAVSSLDQWTHIFKFKEESLSKVALGLASGETRMITFFAPKTPGTYHFFCDVPGHEGFGEEGEMLVK